MKFLMPLILVGLLAFVHDGRCARLVHGTGLLTRVIRRFQPEERRRQVSADPWALSNYYGSRSYYPGLFDDDLVGDEDVVAAEPRVVIPKNNNKRGSTVIRLIKRNDQEREEDNF